MQIYGMLLHGLGAIRAENMVGDFSDIYTQCVHHKHGVN